VQLDDKAANRLPGTMLIEQYCPLLKPRLISRGHVLRWRGIAGPCSSQRVAVAPSKRCARVQWIVANRHDAGVRRSMRRRAVNSVNKRLAHDPEKHALGLDPRVGTGFPSGRTRSVCPEIILKQKIERDDDSKKSHPAPGRH